MRDGGASGIQFDVDNQGGWLEVNAGANIPSGDLAPSSIGLATAFGGGIGIWDGGAGGGVTLLVGPVFAGAFGAGGLNLTASGTEAATLQSLNASVSVVAGGNVAISAGSDVNVQPTADANILPGGNIITNLPIADPGVSGALWNDAGTVKVSP